MPRMSRRVARGLIVAVALANAAFFIAYQSRDWATYWTDQNGYMMLGETLAKTGRFTRYPQSPVYVPEVLRTPGYPAFVAGVTLLFGPGHMPVAIAQALVFAAIALLAYAIGLWLAGERTAFAAGLATALYPTLPYFGALTMSDLLTALLVTLGFYAWLRTLSEGGRWIAVAGAGFAAAAITRPSFQLLPVALLLCAAIVAPVTRAALRRGVLVLAVAAALVSPWVLYNVIYFHAVTLAPPAAGIGRNLWEGHWQIAFPGRVQAKYHAVALFSNNDVVT